MEGGRPDQCPSVYRTADATGSFADILDRLHQEDFQISHQALALFLTNTEPMFGARAADIGFDRIDLGQTFDHHLGQLGLVLLEDQQPAA